LVDFREARRSAREGVDEKASSGFFQKAVWFWRRQWV
jgi:hypothetical protein